MNTSRCKILTYNIFHDLPAYRQLDRRLDLIAAQIAVERPDVIALQEVSRTALCGDVGARLRNLTNKCCGSSPYRLDYARADGAGEGEFAFEDGVALMSLLAPSGQPEILKFEAQVALSAHLAGHHYRLPDDRIAMRMRYVLTGDREIEVCVTHLTDRRETIDGVPARLMQARELARWIQTATDPSVPLVLGGDFNDVPDSETIQAIKAAGLTDIWETAGSGPGYTNDKSDIDPESPDGSHNQRIDYLFFRPGNGGFEFEDVRLFLDRPSQTSEEGWLWASDHMGVIATIRL